MHRHGGAVLQLRHSNLPPSGSNCSAQVRFRACVCKCGRPVFTQTGGETDGAAALVENQSHMCSRSACVCVCESTGEERRANRGLFMYGSMLEKRP